MAAQCYGISFWEAYQAKKQPSLKKARSKNEGIEAKKQPDSRWQLKMKQECSYSSKIQAQYKRRWKSNPFIRLQRFREVGPSKFVWCVKYVIRRSVDEIYKS